VQHEPCDARISAGVICEPIALAAIEAALLRNSQLIEFIGILSAQTEKAHAHF
jgi:hypothetical protein